MPGLGNLNEHSLKSPAQRLSRLADSLVVLQHDVAASAPVLTYAHDKVR